MGRGERRELDAPIDQFSGLLPVVGTARERNYDLLSRSFFFSVSASVSFFLYRRNTSSFRLLPCYLFFLHLSKPSSGVITSTLGSFNARSTSSCLLVLAFHYFLLSLTPFATFLFARWIFHELLVSFFYTSGYNVLIILQLRFRQQLFQLRLARWRGN